MRTLQKRLDDALLAIVQLMAYYCDMPRQEGVQKILYFWSCATRILITAEEAGLISMDEYENCLRVLTNMGLGEYAEK